MPIAYTCFFGEETVRKIRLKLYVEQKHGQKVSSVAVDFNVIYILPLFEMDNVNTVKICLEFTIFSIT